MPEPVRLVIWDLDGTLWRGTLTEGGIEEHLHSNYETIRQLARRGIMNSICSKNDFDRVKAILMEQCIWEYFIFPSIDWSPKTPRIAQLIEQTQLRPETVLFIDDHHGNRAEAAELVPGLQIWDETLIDRMLESPLLKGKDDESLSRLAQYKLLEEKENERKSYATDVNEFLRNSNIVVEIDYDIESHLDRVVELINRTNQLNFTKRRLPNDLAAAREELRSQLSANYEQRAGIVKVRDRFGDYGVVGFWLMGGVWGNAYLAHFVFSCRTIGMGIEQWVYHRLGSPNIRIVGEVVAKLDFDPDWINTGPRESSKQAERNFIPAVRLRGGCELEVMKHYFAMNTSKISSELLHACGIHAIWTSEITTLFNAEAMRTEAGRQVLARLNLSADDYRTTFLDPCDEPTLLVACHAFNEMHALYRHKEHGLVLPIFFHGASRLTKLSESEVEQYFEYVKYDEKQKQEFLTIRAEICENYEPIEDPYGYVEQMYVKLGQCVPANALLVVLLPPTFARRHWGVVTLEDQVETNTIIKRALGGLSNVRMIEMGEHAQSVDRMLEYSHLHFKREVYLEIYDDIMKQYSDWSGRSR